MNNEQLLNTLQEKMSAELDKFRDWLLTQPPEEILEHTFEYSMKGNIVLLIDNAELSDSQLKALMCSHTPLADVYKVFDNMDTGLMDTIQSCLEDRADTVLKLQQEKRQDAPKKESVLGRLHEKAAEPSKPHVPAKGHDAR